MTDTLDLIIAFGGAGDADLLDELLHLFRRRRGQVRDRKRHDEVEQAADGADALGRDAEEPGVEPGLGECVTDFCGDDIINLAEVCDDGPDNSNITPFACAEDCLSVNGPDP